VQILDAAHDAEERRIAPIVAAHLAEQRALAVGLGEVAALVAGPDRLVEARQLLAEVARDARIGGEEVEDVALRRLLPDAGESGEELDQPPELRGRHGGAAVRACRGS
jgi:hypothetical protein